MSVYPESEQGRQNVLIGTSIAFVALGTIFVFLRLTVRHFAVHNIGLDDALIVLAWFFTLGYEAEIMLGIHNKAGKKSQNISLPEMINILKITLAIEVTYYAIIYCIKISLLLVYLRFGVSKIFRTLCLATIAVLSCFFVVCIIVTLAQCVPMEGQWDLVGAVKATCINTTAFFYATSGFNILTDIWIIVLPIPTLRAIQRPVQEKVALFAVFGIGIFSCIASIARLHTIYIFTESTDKFYNTVPVNLWSIIEVNVGIMCACIPALKPLLSRSQRHRTRAYQSPGYKYNSDGQPYSKSSGSGVSSKRFQGGSSSRTGGSSFRLESLHSKPQAGKKSADLGLSPSGGELGQSPAGSRERILQLSHDRPLPPDQVYQGPGIYYSRDATVDVSRR